jgi:hypothetical protein
MSPNASGAPAEHDETGQVANMIEASTRLLHFSDAPYADDPRRRRRLRREALASAAAAAALAALLAWVGPPGGDVAAHAYQRQLFIDHGFTLWDNFWYAGRYSFVSYSVLYYPLAALVGIKLLVVATVAAAGYLFAVVAGREWGLAARPSSRTFALVWSGVVLAGTYPFALGIALVLVAVAALQTGRPGRFTLFSLLTLAASPLAFVILVLILCAATIERRAPWRQMCRPALVTVAVATTGVILWRLFPAGGWYPFPSVEFAAASAFFAVCAALTWRVERAQVLRWLFAANLVACVAAYLVPSALGENVARLRLAALPLAVLVLSLRRWQPRRVVIGLLVFAVCWNAGPLVTNLRQGELDVSAAPAYWQTAIDYLRANLNPSYRVEVVDTVDHWEAAYLPAVGIPLVRGWFRQDDLPFNTVLYRRHLDARAYLGWLHAVGARWVVLTSAPPDYSARSEAALLRSGASGLTPVLKTSTTTIFSVPAPRPIVTGPARARVGALQEARIVLSVDAPGTYRIAVRYTPYWHASSGCVSRGGDGMLRLTTPTAGRVTLAFDLDPRAALMALTGSSPPRCHD